jgi:hypothetical protein
VRAYASSCLASKLPLLIGGGTSSRARNARKRGGGATALPHGRRSGSALHSPACTPNQAPSAAHHALPVSGQSSVVHVSLCRCVSCALCEKISALPVEPRTPHPGLVVALCLRLAVSVSRGRCAAVAPSVLLYPMPVLPIPAHARKKIRRRGELGGLCWSPRAAPTAGRADGARWCYEPKPEQSKSPQRPCPGGLISRPQANFFFRISKRSEKLSVELCSGVRSLRWSPSLFLRCYLRSLLQVQ